MSPFSDDSATPIISQNQDLPLHINYIKNYDSQPARSDMPLWRAGMNGSTATSLQLTEVLSRFSFSAVFKGNPVRSKARARGGH